MNNPILKDFEKIQNEYEAANQLTNSLSMKRNELANYLKPLAERFVKLYYGVELYIIMYPYITKTDGKIVFSFQDSSLSYRRWHFQVSEMLEPDFIKNTARTIRQKELEDNLRHWEEQIRIAQEQISTVKQELSKFYLMVE